MSERTGLKEWREANGLTVREVAALTGLSAVKYRELSAGSSLPALKKVPSRPGAQRRPGRPLLGNGWAFRWLTLWLRLSR